MLYYVYAAVIVLCLITFRSIPGVICAVLPLMLTSVLCEALMVWLGIGVKVSTLPVIALGVGIGVDYSLYVGAVGGGVAQLQGVWVHPSLRGRGLARAGLAAVIAGTRATLAPTVSLYVNDFNTPAIAAYEAIGFNRVGMFSTVMF